MRQQSQITAVALDMWKAYANAVAEKMPQADIVHDRSHINQHLNEAVGKERRKEHKQLAEVGDKRLAGSKFHWLANQENLPKRHSESFEVLRNSRLKVARAWAIKELFRDFGRIRRVAGQNATLKNGIRGQFEVASTQLRPKRG